MLTVEPISAFSDNYIWLIRRDNKAWVVDPGDASPVIDRLEQLSIDLEGILITHHHFDHTGGIDGLRRQYPQLQLITPPSENIPQEALHVRAGDEIQVLGTNFSVLAIPGHTLDHIAYFAARDNSEPLLFCGDTLFAGGCGRVFEGTNPMMHQSLQLLAQLPPATQVFCAHEYTMANLNFALAVEPDNQKLKQRIERDGLSREENRPTVPSSLALELETNPFLRCEEPQIISAMHARSTLVDTSAAAVFGAIRQWKNDF
ncbi:MAG: hydroxyacylglutathione hydrolase [Pseudomonadales bacterium]